MAASKARAAAPRNDGGDDGIPEDIDAVRHDLARRIEQLISDAQQRWHSCRERSCRRARNCRAPRGGCVNPKPHLKPAKPEQAARTMAQFQRMVRERVAQMDADEKAGRNDDGTHKKT